MMSIAGIVFTVAFIVTGLTLTAIAFGYGFRDIVSEYTRGPSREVRKHQVANQMRRIQ